MEKISISKQNEKLGAMHSVSLPAGITCDPSAPCFSKCYARRLAKRYTNVERAYLKNFDVLHRDRGSYFAQIKKDVRLQRAFRWHISGDILDADYFRRVVDVAESDPACEHVIFTKRFSFVNEVIQERLDAGKKKLPKNLHVIFSGWGRDFRPINPHRLSVAECWLKKGEKPFSGKSSMICPEQIDPDKKWKCVDCYINKIGCFSARPQNIILLEH